MSEIALETEFDLALSLAPEETYNPLDFIEGEDDEDWIEDDSLLLPNALLSESAAPKKQSPVFSPERAGSVTQAVRDLVTTNAGRRDVLLSIINWAREGISASALFPKIIEAQKDNLSVYEPVSFCRMLERAGAVNFELSQSAPEDNGSVTVQGVEENQTTGYLTIKEDVDPQWQATEEGLSAYADLILGNEWRERVLGSDSVYAEVYFAVMDAMRTEGRPKNEIVSLAEAFEVTKNPRKFGAYFVDVLEATSVIRWGNGVWSLTNLGRDMLPELKALCEQN